MCRSEDGWSAYEQQLCTVQAIISSQDDGHYSDGWGVPRKHFNWICYVFYGGVIRDQAVDWLLGQVSDIARIAASDEDGDRVRGLFLAGHEVNGMSEWQIRDGGVRITPADTRYQYLDA